MSIPTNAKPTGIRPMLAGANFIDPKSGSPTIEALQQQDSVRNYVNGGGRLFACVASGTNVITLTPNGHGDEDGVSPLLEGYRFGDAFLLWAANTSTGSVTATVVPKSGTLATLKVYIDNGASQAGAGHISQNLVYSFIYAPHLDSNAGGFVVSPGVTAALAAHLAGAPGHPASDISFVPAGSVAATDVQAAIAELDGEKQPLDSDLTAIAALATMAYGRALLTLADEDALEALLDTLPNLASIQGVAFTFGAYAATLLNNANEAAFKAAVNLEAADILAALLTVDGASSGLDADLLDGNSSAFFSPASVSGTAAAILASLLTVDGSGSGLDADLLDGQSSAAFQATSAPVTKIADFTLGDAEHWIINDRGATNTVTLPTAPSWPGRAVRMKTIQAQAVVSAGSDVVPRAGGAAGTAILPATDGAWATLVSDGTNWVLMEGTP